MTEDTAWGGTTSPPAAKEAPVAASKPTPEPVAAAPVEEVPLNPPGYGRPVGEEAPAPLEPGVTGPRFKVEPPRSAFEWGGLKVTDEWTPVPPELVGALRSAAQDVGIELTEEV